MTSGCSFSNFLIIDTVSSSNYLFLSSSIFWALYLSCSLSLSKCLCLSCSSLSLLCSSSQIYLWIAASFSLSISLCFSISCSIWRYLCSLLGFWGWWISKGGERTLSGIKALLMLDSLVAAVVLGDCDFLSLSYNLSRYITLLITDYYLGGDFDLSGDCDLGGYWDLNGWCNTACLGGA